MRFIAFATVGGMLLSVPVLAADGLSIGGGVNYSSGDYGTSTPTHITSTYVTGRYDTGPWTFKVTVPYLFVSGNTDTIPGIGHVPNSNPHGRGRAHGAGASAPTTATTTSGSADGLGDITAAVTYNAYFNANAGLGVDLIGKVKFGTADADKGLGTGETDYGSQIDVYKTHGEFTVFGGIGYTAMGDSTFIQLNNVFNANAGVTYKAADRTSVGLTFDAREKVSDTSSPQRELTLFLTQSFAKAWKAQLYGLKGFSNGSPDWGVGASIGRSF